MSLDMSRMLWVLLLVHLAGRVSGVTKLQKIGVLVAKQVKEATKLGFYSDWRAHRYGAYSPQLAQDIKDALAQGYLSEDKIGKKEVFYPSDKGSKLVSDNITLFNSVIGGVKAVVDVYNPMSDEDLLLAVYTRYPEFSVNSRIAGRVISTFYAKKEEEAREASKRSADYDVRLSLAKQINLKGVPIANNRALLELKGLIGNLLKGQELNATDEVRVVRGQ